MEILNIFCLAVKNNFFHKKRFLVVVFFVSVFTVPGFSQNADTITTIAQGTTAENIKVDTTGYYQTHSPVKATIYSMVLPGLGQIYNKKYWKLPIVYAGFGVFFYFASTYNKEYKKYREAYYYKLQYPDGPPLEGNEYEQLYDEEFLLDAKNFYRRNRDFNYILSGLWYVLVIVDATVDAHLYTWEVDDDLSLKLEPQFYPGFNNYKTGGGLKLSLRF